MDFEKAIEILSKRGDQIAEALGVQEDSNWRDNTGTAHLYIRGAFQPLERISKQKHSVEDASIAIGTVGFANKSPKGFLGENTSESAKVAMTILQAEMSGKTLSDTVSIEDIELLESDLQGFTDSIVNQASQTNVPESLKAFAGTLEIANTYYQTLAHSWKNEISSPAPNKSNNSNYKPNI